MDRRATGKVIGVAFSRDGNVLATTSDDGSVSVWDVPTATLRETFTGHVGAAVGPVFSPDGSRSLHGLARRQRDRVGCARRPAARAAVPVLLGCRSRRWPLGGAEGRARCRQSGQLVFRDVTGPERVSPGVRGLAESAQLQRPCGGIVSRSRGATTDGCRSDGQRTATRSSGMFAGARSQMGLGPANQATSASTSARRPHGGSSAATGSSGSTTCARDGASRAGRERSRSRTWTSRPTAARVAAAGLANTTRSGT